MITASRFPAFVAVALAASAFAAPGANAEGNPEQGRTLAYTCLGCHGVDGYRNAYPSYRVPKLGGQRREYIEAALQAYRDGSRPHPTMQAQGNGLSNQDIEDLAAWFEGEAVAKDDVTRESVASLSAAAACVDCHGAGNDAVMPVPPTLSGQHRDYLVHALKQYRDGARAGTVMSAFAGALSDEDLQAVANYYSRQDGLGTPDATD